jgi:hypothetical protein
MSNFSTWPAEDCRRRRPTTRPSHRWWPAEPRRRDPPPACARRPGLHAAQLYDVILQRRFPPVRLSRQDFIELNWGLSPITAHRQSNLPRLITRFERIPLATVGYNRRSIKSTGKLNCRSRGNIYQRWKYHDSKNIYLVSSHPYVSPFMLIQVARHT